MTNTNYYLRLESDHILLAGFCLKKIDKGVKFTIIDTNNYVDALKFDNETVEIAEHLSSVFKMFGHNCEIEKGCI
jgi:hypothetical protein